MITDLFGADDMDTIMLYFSTYRVVALPHISKRKDMNNSRFKLARMYCRWSKCMQLEV